MCMTYQQYFSYIGFIPCPFVVLLPIQQGLDYAGVVLYLHEFYLVDCFG